MKDFQKSYNYNDKGVYMSFSDQFDIEIREIDEEDNLILRCKKMEKNF